MARVPIIEPEVQSLPGASNVPHATADMFGGLTAKATILAGHAIKTAGVELGDSLTNQYNEQQAVESKSVLSDHIAAVDQFTNDIKQNGDPAQASLIPDKVKAFRDADWQQRSGGLSGKFRPIADANARNYANTHDTALRSFVNDKYESYVEAQISQSVGKHATNILNDPANLESASLAIKGQIEELDPVRVPVWKQRELKIKFAQQLSTAYGESLKRRGDAAGFMEWADKSPSEMSRLFDIRDAPPPVPTSGGLNSRRVSQIDRLSVGPMIDAEARRQGFDPALAKVVASVESGGRADAQTGSYGGVFQLSKSEFDRYGGGDIHNPADNIRAGIASLKARAAEFKAATGRDAGPTELYLGHQQGAAGSKNHYASPDAPAWMNMAATGEGRQKGERWAQLAIWGNIPDDIKPEFGLHPKNFEKDYTEGRISAVSSREFIGIWDSKITGGTRYATAQGITATDAQPIRMNADGTAVAQAKLPAGNEGRPEIKNPDGSISTERTITVGADGKFYNLPTIINGKQVSDDEAIAAWKAGNNPNVGPAHADQAAAEAAARERSRQIGLARKPGDVAPAPDATQTGRPAMFGTAKEFVDHYQKMQAEAKTFLAEQKQKLTEIRTHADSALEHENEAIKSQGTSGINQLLTDDRIKTIYGVDAPRILDKRNAALQYHAATGHWNSETATVEMDRDLAGIDPKNIDPQTPAFKEYVDNFKHAQTYKQTILTARDKTNKIIEEEAAKEMYRRGADNKKPLTQEYLDKIAPLLTATHYKAGLELVRNANVREDVLAVGKLIQDKYVMAPEQYREAVANAINNGWIKADKGFAWIDDNVQHHNKDQPAGPYKLAEMWLKGRADPGLLSGAAEALMRRHQEETLNTFAYWRLSNPNATHIEAQLAAEHIAELNPMVKIYGDIRQALPISEYFPRGMKAEAVTPEIVAAAREKNNIAREKGVVTVEQWQRSDIKIRSWETFLRDIPNRDTANAASAAAALAARKNPMGAMPPPVVKSPPIAPKGNMTEDELIKQRLDNKLGR